MKGGWKEGEGGKTGRISEGGDGGVEDRFPWRGDAVGGRQMLFCFNKRYLAGKGKVRENRKAPWKKGARKPFGKGMDRPRRPSPKKIESV